VMGNLQMPKPETPMYYGFPLPTLMLVLAVALGVLLALLSRVFVSIGAKSRARAADKRMRSAIDGVTEELILAPISAELETYKQARTGIERALH